MHDAYAKSQIHRVVYIAVINNKGEILLQLRSPKVYNFPNCWDISVAGHVDKGETYKSAALRELTEELGIDLQTLSEIGYFYNEFEHKGNFLRRFNKVYKLVISDKRKISANPNEVTDIDWLTPNAIARLINQDPSSVASGLKDCMSHIDLSKI